MIPLFFFHASSYASNTVVVVDGSGSVAGMSIIRPHNSIRMITAELTEYLSGLSAQDTISLIHFTDKIKGIYTYAGYNEEIQTVIDSLRYIPKGNTDFSVALSALNGIPGHHRVIFISDGLNNAGTSNEVVFNQLKQLTNELNGEVYFLLLDDEDTNNAIIQYAINSDNITLVKSLSDIPSYFSFDADTNSCLDIITDDSTLSSLGSASLTTEFEVDPSCHFDWESLKIILIVFALIALIILVGYLIYQLMPLFVQTSAGAMQKAIFVLYSLPKGVFNVVFKMLPEKVKEFLTGIMPNKDSFNKGKVIPVGEQQQKTLDAMRKETGKVMKYKNGETDFGPVAKYKVRLRGSLDSNIPQTLDPRSKVYKAQEAARDQMLKSKKGRNIIAQYVGKSQSDVNVDDYTCWKDDMLNFGKPSHNPLTPHETIDGRYIMWVPKKYHDASCGGVSHSGGVSLLKSIRIFLSPKA